MREERVRLTLSIKDMAEKCHAHTNSIENWEKGKTPINVAMLMILRGMGFDIGYIVTGERGDGSLGFVERQLIASFGQLSQREKQAVLSMVAGLTGEPPIYLEELRPQGDPTLHDAATDFKPPEPI